MKKIYLAIRYTGMEELSFSLVNIIAGKLIKEGYSVFSPISHSHPIAKAFDLPTDSDYWARLNESWIAWCDELWVVKMLEWEKSRGIERELLTAKRLGKPIQDYSEKGRFQCQKESVMIG